MGYRECPNCRGEDGKPLRLHKHGKRLVCKVCGYTIKRGVALALREVKQ